MRADTAVRVARSASMPILRPWHAACRLYLEGFPVGSYTALLEAAQAERPFVRKPLLAPPSGCRWTRARSPILGRRTDRRRTPKGARLVDDPHGARRMAARRAACARRHVAHWPDAPATLCDSLPAIMSRGVLRDCPPMPMALASYAAGVLPITPTSRRSTSPVKVAVQQGLHPRPDLAVLEAVACMAAA